MLRIDDLHFAMEGRPLLEGASVIIPQGHKVGLVGRNGAGKTTLFRLILGELEADRGSVSLPKGLRIGAVAQEAPASNDSLLDTVLAADTERASLMAEAESATDPTRIAEIQLRLADIDAYSAEARASAVLSGLGFDTAAQARACREFSGGWRMRVALAAVLFAQPDLLLLDEPTNYLDLEGSIWLESYLARYPHSVLLISHDRGLLSRAVRHILHLSLKDLTLYGGNYDQFEATRRAKMELAAAFAKKQEHERAHLQSFVDRFRYTASKARQAQSRIKRLEKMEPISNLIEGDVAGFSFKCGEELAPPILRLDACDVGYDGQPVLRNLDMRIDPDDRIALLGANGQGKSTLSKLVSGRLKPMTGRVVNSSKLRIGYFAQHQVDELTIGDTPLDHLAALRPGMAPARLRSILAQGGIGEAIADNPIERLSGGQKARLAMLIATLDDPHLVILDEPTNHLDIESREALIHALTAYSGAVILVSHDPHLVDCVADRLWLVDSGEVAPFDGDMDDYRRFLLARRDPDAPKVPQPKAEKPKQAAAPRASAGKPAAKRALSPSKLREEVSRCEERIDKLAAMLGQIDALMATANVFRDPDRMAELAKKRAEVVKANEKAEALWVKAQAALDAAASA